MADKQTYLYDKLRALSNSDFYPFHMPGHKRNLGDRPLGDLAALDITEIDEFDNLHEPEGILQAAMERAAQFYHATQTYFLVNGSSCGVLAALLACVDHGGKVLMGRNAHKSAYHALYLGQLTPVYLIPKVVAEYGFAGGIDPEEVRDALEHEPDIQAVFLTSPTYDGMISDIQAIVEVAHAKGVPVIVDEAHGAHLVLFQEYRGKSAVSCGADLVIQSIHKTLPAPTQTAILHRNGNLVAKEQIERYLHIFQSSSPSYVLMSGMDQCFRILEREGESLVEQYRENYQCFVEKTQQLSCIKRYGDDRDRKKWSDYHILDADFGKLVIGAKHASVSGKMLYDRLRTRYHLQMEMAAPSYVLAMTSIFDTREGFDRLAEALLAMDDWLKVSMSKTGDMEEESSFVTCEEEQPWVNRSLRPSIRLSLYEAQNREKEWVTFEHAVGRVAAETVNLYPPGIPLFVPGEEITESLIIFLNNCLLKKLHVQGIRMEQQPQLAVVK